MRLFHVSENSNISCFEPRMPRRKEVGNTPLVWAINERCLPNYLTPRNCPRVAYHTNPQTTDSDIANFFTAASRHCIIIENDWFDRLSQAVLYVYEFNPKNFYLQDEIAGYYVSEQTEAPINVHSIDDIFKELIVKNIELRIVDNLHQIAQKVQNSTLNWSLCVMRNAKPQ
ncbi:MAG: hypothetical protein FWE33_05570 [Defluviitaleaceae bacterium]|nr:hypothetical protein [Defluviitaleaceae bacterium]